VSLVKCELIQKYEANINSYDLPMDVFEAGEIKPARKSKAKMVKNGELGSKKRTFSSTQMDVRAILNCSPPLVFLLRMLTSSPPT